MVRKISNEVLDMHIGYDMKKGVEYGKICCSHWIDGKDKKTYVNLGRVIDKEKLIFKNRQRGLFQFIPENNEYISLDESEYSLPAASSRHSLILNFGDSWFLDQYIRQTGLFECIEKIHCSHVDTVLALVQYYILNNLGLCHACDWYEHSYASLLYPQANMSSQRISEQLAQIGSEESYRSFFASYIDLLKKECVDIQNILIDSTGLPNSIHFPLTGLSNHNGKISNEVRLIYVTQEQSGIPVYLRYVQGTVPDVSTVSATILELAENGIPVDEALLDAGYYSEKNIQTLYKANIRFVCRMKQNLSLYKALAAEYKAQLESQENMVKFGKRVVFIKKKPVQLAPNCPGFAYICLDLARKSIETEKLLDRLDPKENVSSELFESLESEGIFVLASSVNLPVEQILPVYYTRQQVEQTFDICKNYTDLLPLRIESEETFRGHLLLTFIGACIVRRIQNTLLQSEKKSSGRLNPTSLFQNLGYQHCSVYKDKIVIHEADSKANRGYKIFKINYPAEIKI